MTSCTLNYCRGVLPCAAIKRWLRILCRKDSRAMINLKTLLPLQAEQQRAWLYRTIKKIYINHIRHSAFELPAEEVPETADIANQYRLSDLTQLLNFLSGTERTLFQMRYIEGYNSKELSEIFHMPPGTIRSILSLARKNLRRIMKK